MKTLYTVALECRSRSRWPHAKLKAYTVSVLLLLLGLVLPAGEAVGQQAGPTLHRYLVRAVLTADGLKNLQKQPPTALKAGGQVSRIGRGQARVLVFRLRGSYCLCCQLLPRRNRRSHRAVEYECRRVRARDDPTASLRRGDGPGRRKVAPRPRSATTIEPRWPSSSKS